MTAVQNSQISKTLCLSSFENNFIIKDLFWLRERTLTWEGNINTISKTAGNCPQYSYAAVVWAIQSKWIFLQCVTWDTGDAFVGVEKMIQETFLLRLLFGKMKTLSPIVGTLSTMPINVEVLGLLNPVTSVKEKYWRSQQESRKLIRAVTGGGSPIPTTYRRSGKKDVT